MYFRTGLVCFMWSTEIKPDDVVLLVKIFIKTIMRMHCNVVLFTRFCTFIMIVIKFFSLGCCGVIYVHNIGLAKYFGPNLNQWSTCFLHSPMILIEIRVMFFLITTITVNVKNINDTALFTLIINK